MLLIQPAQSCFKNAYVVMVYVTEVVDAGTVESVFGPMTVGVE